MTAVDWTLTGRALLAAAAAEVTSWPSTSDSRARQVRWVAGEYGRALAHPDHPLDEEATVKQIYRYGHVETYLRLARSGALRVRTARDPGKRSDSSEQIRLEVLGLLVKACGAEDYAHLPAQPDPPSKPPVAPRPRSLLRAQLTELADAPGATAGRLRMLAIGATVCDTGVRAGELCARTVEDLAPTLEELRVVRRPQGWSEAEAYVEILALSGLSRAALRRWLPERQALLARGASGELWVSLRGNHLGGQTTPAGTPLQTRGLSRAWTRAVAETNTEMAGEPDWRPLPTRMEQLRRGVRPTARRAPREPDAERAAVLLDDVAGCGRVLAYARAQEEGTTAELAARVAVRQAVTAAWAEGIEHAVQLSVLAEAGLRDDAALAAAGWERVLLAAVERGLGWGRPSRAAAVG
ncbi:hypothetical protein BX261_7281 [Streptomyces sp. 2321.6]|uniref:hypothetical protein n=1 Tax=Streptomyces sp. 2321.6 TaxID=1938840 RepID=UPI000BB12AB3|nr:hypothetical protein [Streptomyces sp. 2321.6]PBC72407.1 hypothetical protein BX261_7281 [Streptomyces sp. 2321.6]